MIYNINCNLLDASVEAIAHCCNSFHTFGVGIALNIKKEYPKAFLVDKQTKYGDINKLGTISIYYTNPIEYKNKTIKWIFNIYGQFRYGREKRHLDYEALYCGLEKVKDFCIKKQCKSIGFPNSMGCKNAGGNWNIVKIMIEEIFKETNIDVYICEYN